MISNCELVEAHVGLLQPVILQVFLSLEQYKMFSLTIIYTFKIYLVTFLGNTTFIISHDDCI